MKQAAISTETPQKPTQKRPKNRAKIGNFLLIFACFLYGFALIIFPARYIQTTLNGFVLWAECVLPSLFPFMVLSGLLIKLGVAEKAALPLKRLNRLLRLPPMAPVCFLLSITAGYPTGSRTIWELYQSGLVNQRGAKTLSLICTTTGPVFCLATVGAKLFASVWVGVKIYLCHIASVLLMGLPLARFLRGDDGATKPLPKSNMVIYDSFVGATQAVLLCGAFIAFFATFAQMAQDFYLTKPLMQLLTTFLGEKLAYAATMGLMEMTTGCALCAAVGGKLAVCLAGFLITFGGLSVLMQQLCYLTQAEVKPFRWVGIKLLQASLCFLLLWLIV